MEIIKKIQVLFLTAFFLQVNAYAQQGTWTLQNSGTAASLNSVCFVNENFGWAVGGSTIIHTTDGGDNWMPQEASISGHIIDFWSVQFIDELNGWVVGTGYTPGGAGNSKTLILNTYDGGLNWNIQYFEHGPTLKDVYFVDGQNGWAVGEPNLTMTSPNIFHTNDGGNTWTEQSSGITITTSHVSLSSVFFINATTGWAAGLGGTVTHTTDGGNNWIAQTIDSIGNIRQVEFFDPLNGWAYGQGGITSSTDGGNTWVSQNSFSSGLVCVGGAVAFPDNNLDNGWAVCGLGHGFRTTDGTTWNMISSSIPTTKSLKAISFINSTLGWAVGDEGTIIHFSGEEAVSVDNMEFQNFSLKTFPNPFSHETTISFVLKDNQHVNLRIFDLYGREVTKLTDKQLQAGEHQFVFNGYNRDSGIYIYHIQIDGKLKTGKIVLNK